MGFEQSPSLGDEQARLRTVRVRGRSLGATFLRRRAFGGSQSFSEVTQLAHGRVEPLCRQVLPGFGPFSGPLKPDEDPPRQRNQRQHQKKREHDRFWAHRQRITGI